MKEMQKRGSFVIALVLALIGSAAERRPRRNILQKCLPTSRRQTEWILV
jgi:hypothetical protein